jgi:hypothetical protein
METKYTYILTHNHKHGTDCHRFTSQRCYAHLPSIEVVADLLDIDYEPGNDGEWAEIVDVSTTPDLDELLWEKGI